MNPVAEDILMHVGVGKMDGAPGPGSGRYPLGSGQNPYQHSGDFLSRVEKLKKEGFSETEIAKAMGLSTTQLRAQKAIAKTERRTQQISKVKELQAEGYNATQIAKMMGLAGESSVRALLNEKAEDRMLKSQKIAAFLKEQIDTKGMIDVGEGIERELGVSKEKLNEALEILKADGYPVYGGGVPQVTNPGKQTNLRVVCPPGTEHKEIYQFDKINYITEYSSKDGGETFETFKYPESMNSKRLQIRYAEEGGSQKDGVIELRRGVDDLSLGNAHYAQVRILVDGTHYLKGMAVYSDDMPDGVDVIFNTNKHKGTPALGDKESGTVLKQITDDPDNPFGSLIKANGQSYYIDKDGNKKLSLINKRAEEGDWEEWSDSLPSQFLGKQNKDLIQKQLNLSLADKRAEFEEICALTNPTVKRYRLNEFADECDSAAVSLQAAALPGQKYQVILPLTSLKDDEIYAPRYEDGSKVALIRYPHGSTSEIPILTVNNKNAEGKRVITPASIDAVGITSKVAERLSGADFDGDTVQVIPTGRNVKITSTPPLKGLEGFDPKEEYPARDGSRKIKTTHQEQTEMGKISNLITDMTLLGASPDECARAIRHSMVVIDSKKHGLDYKKSEKDNNIQELREKYQVRYDENGNIHYGGASTILSRASSEIDVPKRKGSPHVDPETGKMSYTEAHETYVDKKGKTHERAQKSTRMAETDDAYTLVSEYRTPKELLYADYANDLKSLANQSRKTAIETGKLKYSASAAKVYEEERANLAAQLNEAKLNAPRERKAQLLANANIAAKTQTYPELKEDKKTLKKLKQQELERARAKTGAKRTPIVLTDKLWEAIQAGAISDNALSESLKYMDSEDLKKRSTPHASTTLSDAKINKINRMKDSGYTTSDIAKAVGVSTSTVTNYLKK